MKNAWSMISAGALLGSLAVVAPVRADVSCVSTPNSISSILVIGDAPNPIRSGTKYYIGNFDFYGASVVGVCLEGTSTSSLHAIVQSDNNGLLGWLPKQFNHLCLTDGVDQVQALQESQTHCGITMHPLNYAGNRLVLYGKGDDDMFIGGNGVDIMYGGPGKDILQDYHPFGMNGFYNGTMMGESGRDRLVGSDGSGTVLDGGADNDMIGDKGGDADKLRGGSGNECCMDDQGNRFAEFSCGSGTDTVPSLAGKSSDCNRESANCSFQSNEGFCQ